MPAQPPRAASPPVWVVALALASAVSAAYLPALDAEFLNWDDNIAVSDNPHIRTLSWETVRWALTSTRAGYAMPLTWLSHALDVWLYGLDPRRHHGTNVFLHVANTLLVFAVLRTLTGALWPSATVAALFGLHPLHVEPVAWIAQRKEVLSAFFSLLTLLAYNRAVRARTRAGALTVAAAFLAALLSKPMAMTLPAVLLLLDYWPLRRLSWRSVAEKIPLLVIAVACALWALVGGASVGALRSGESITFPSRIANAVVSYARYLQLTVWPRSLSPWYSHPALEGEPLAPTTVTAAALVLAALSLFALACLRRRPYVTFGWLWYLGTLLPVIGLVPLGSHGMADRYTYIPLIGVFLAVVWLAASPSWWRLASVRWSAGALVVALLAACGVLTWRQSQVWHDSATFWAYTLRSNPHAAVGHYAVANMLASEQRHDEAIAAYRRAIKLRRDFWNWHAEVGDLLYGSGRIAAAAAHYRKAIKLNPEEPVIRNSLANVLIQQNRLAAAQRQLEAALKLRPEFAEARNNLGLVLAKQDRWQEAAAEFRKALAIKPDFTPARRNLTLALAALAEDQE